MQGTRLPVYKIRCEKGSTKNLHIMLLISLKEVAIYTTGLGLGFGLGFSLRVTV